MKEKKSASEYPGQNNVRDQLVHLIRSNKNIFNFLLKNPSAQIKDLEESGVTGYKYSTLVKRISQLREAQLLSNAHRLGRPKEVDIMKVLFRNHYFIGVIVNHQEVYRSKEDRKVGKERLVKRIIRKGFPQFQDTIVLSASMILGTDTEIILNVYSNEDIYELVESIRQVKGVYSTRTYEVVKEMRYSDILEEL